MRLSRKGATNGIPLWLLAVTIGLLIFRVALWAGHSQQVALKFVNWRPYTDLETIAKVQEKPLLLYFVGDGGPKIDMMDDIVFSNRMVAACILKDFYPIIVPGANQFEGAERLYIRKLYKKYMVVQVPSLVVATASGTEAAHTNGFKPSAQTYQFLKTVKEGPRLREIESLDQAPKIPHRSESRSDSDSEESERSDLPTHHSN
ncbi:MAG TPA: hypothetical protein V6C89_18555 [Drouetiella sp.]|jgi:hypothetical protein